ncbi:hypothetical protein MH215_25725 [Paenibacillus sp. ACRSA]|nr:hypothetical protein [Paenibacillus sp. ACRSA]MCG7380381.1 hypothetical protein [Paenibacillus sp. ACRSA]
MRFLYTLILFLVGMACSALLHAGSLKLSDGVLFVIAGILFQIWRKLD